MNFDINSRRKPRGRIQRAALKLASAAQVRLAGQHRWRLAAGRALKGIGAGIGYSTLIEPIWLECTHVEVHVPLLPPAYEGYRIVHLTDIHHNIVSGEAYLERVVEKANALDPDMVAVTGDFITHNPGRLAPCMSILKMLHAPDGVFASRGNHDARVSLETFRATCEAHKLVLLENEHRIVQPHRHRGYWAENDPPPPSIPLVVAGVGDLWTGIMDPGRAMAGAPEESIRLLLAHNPLSAELVSAQHAVALQLSGHTHGGQVRPFNRTLKIMGEGSGKYMGGLARAPHTTVYVSRGVGTSAIRVRWNCRPEITLITLHSQWPAEAAGPGHPPAHLYEA